MRVVALTGAGISKSAGIPTFEDMPDMQRKLSVDYKNQFPEDFEKTMAALREMMTGKQPTHAHYALAEYGVPIITQNIDGLHEIAGSTEVYEIHGSFRDNNIVLYGEKVHRLRDVYDLLSNKDTVGSYLLIIGTRLGTMIPNGIKLRALELGYQVETILEDADKKVPEVLDKLFSRGYN